MAPLGLLIAVAEAFVHFQLSLIAYVCFVAGFIAAFALTALSRCLKEVPAS